jgi:hypothetical protein
MLSQNPSPPPPLERYVIYGRPQKIEDMTIKFMTFAVISLLFMQTKHLNFRSENRSISIYFRYHFIYSMSICNRSSLKNCPKNAM